MFDTLLEATPGQFKTISAVIAIPIVSLSTINRWGIPPIQPLGGEFSISPANRRMFDPPLESSPSAGWSALARLTVAVISLALMI
jgi:hypothetical protein